MHKVTVHSECTRLSKSTAGYAVDVTLSHELDPELTYKLGDDANRVSSSGHFIIRVDFPREYCRNEKHYKSVGEVAALTHYLAVDGFNALRCLNALPATDIQVSTSNSLVSTMLSCDRQARRHRDPKDEHAIKVADTLSPYTFGIAVTLAEPKSCPISLEMATSDARVHVAQIARLSEVVTPLGVVYINRRTIREYVGLPLNRELAVLQGFCTSRPFITVKRLIQSADGVPRASHRHVKSLRDKFGEGCMSLSNSDGVLTWVDLVPLRGGRVGYLVVGFRQFYSNKVKRRLRQKGFGKEFL
ncbi:hypothetical protein ACP3V3_02040 [Vibrio sp. PNB22_3_1]